MKPHQALFWLMSLPIVAHPLSAQTQPPPSVASASADVPPAVAARARALAERSQWFRVDLAGRSRRLSRDAATAGSAGRVNSRTVFIGVDLLDRKEDGEPHLIYRVRHYRYVDDTTVTSLVDIESGRVVEQVETRHLAVPLSAEELTEARTLALADRRVAEAVGSQTERLIVEPLVVRASDPNDPWFGRRVVRLLFRIGRDYVSRPLVYVDLTRREVTVEQAHRPDHGDTQ